MTALRSSALHTGAGFLAMGAWAAFANRTHPMPTPLIAGAVQGTISAVLTFVLKRIVEAVSAPLFVNGAPEHVSSSVGVATCVPGTDPVDLADRAMLVAKRSGRARVVVA